MFAIVLRALKEVDGCCLDTEDERRRVAKTITAAVLNEIARRVDVKVRAYAAKTRRQLARTFSKEFFDKLG